MILVDTSVLIDFLQDKANEGTEKLKYIMDRGIPYGINVYVYQELLQGVVTERDYHELKKYLDTQTFYSLKQGRESYAAAAKIYWDCRKKGYTISSTIDCLVVQTALENGLTLLHNDSDFVNIGKVIKDLKLISSMLQP